MIKSILLPADGSVYTDAQLKHAIHISKAFESRIKVLSIVDVRVFEWAVVMGTDGFVPVVPSNVYKKETKRILESKADAVLKKSSKILKAEKIRFDTEKIHGSPSDIICEKSPLVDLLIVGARGEFAKWRKNLIGATLDAVIRQWNKPILITPQKYEKISRILIAYDGSERSNKALQIVGAMSANLNIPATILSVHDNEQMREKLLNEAGTYLEPYNVTVDLYGVAGNPEKEIITCSKQKKCNLIIMGAFGHSRIREAILGSTTEHVLRQATVPVLLSK